MTDKNKEYKRLVAIMALLADEYTDGKEVSELKIKLWERELLQKYGIGRIEQAALVLIRDRKYNGFPKISEMIGILEGYDDIESIALDQFHTAKKAISSYGSYQSVEFDDYMIHRVISDLGGWQTFCQTEESKWHWTEKKFIELYIHYHKMGKNNELYDVPKFLPGMHMNSPNNLRRVYKPRTNKVSTLHPQKRESKEKKGGSVLRQLSDKLRRVQ